MNAYQILKFHTGGKASHPNNTIIPQLSTGTMPPSQGSAVAASLNPDVEVNQNAVPNPHGLPWMTHQNQKYPVTTSAPAPWVSVPACQANVKPKAKGVGLKPFGAGTLKLPGKRLQTLVIPAI